MEPLKQNSIKKYVVVLSEEERAVLVNLLVTSTLSSRVEKRCKTLLQADEGLSDVQIARNLNCSINCVANLRKRFATEGLERAIYDAQRSGAPNKFVNDQLIAIKEIATSEPPTGRNGWTLQLLQKEAVARGIVKSISIGRLHALIQQDQKNPPNHTTPGNQTNMTTTPNGQAE